MGQRWGGRQGWASCRGTAHEPSMPRGAAVQRVTVLAHPQGDGLRCVWQSAPAPPPTVHPSSDPRPQSQLAQESEICGPAAVALTTWRSVHGPH